MSGSGTRTSPNTASHFVLVHGAGHGAWCWYKVVHMLQESGHEVDALDLASAGINKTEAKAVRTLEEYSSPLVELLESFPENHKVILVGHSMGGISLTYVLEKFPQKIAAAVYLSALMFPSGPEAAALFQQILTRLSDKIVDQYNGSVAYFKLEEAQEMFYALSPSEDVVLAKSLLKPFPIFDPTVNFTSSNYGSVPRYYIKAEQDRAITAQDQDLLISKSPETEVLRLNSDHSPFFSMPKALVDSLLWIATTQSLAC